MPAFRVDGSLTDWGEPRETPLLPGESPTEFRCDIDVREGLTLSEFRQQCVPAALPAPNTPRSCMTHPPEFRQQCVPVALPAPTMSRPCMTHPPPSGFK